MRYSEDVKSRFTAKHRVCIEFSDDVKDKVILDASCWTGLYGSSMELVVSKNRLWKNRKFMR